jgi:hypothetical protein
MWEIDESQRLPRWTTKVEGEAPFIPTSPNKKTFLDMGHTSLLLMEFPNAKE